MYGFNFFYWILATKCLIFIFSLKIYKLLYGHRVQLRMQIEIQQSLGQLFYRPGEAKQTRDRKYKGRDNREMFYSFHFGDFVAECVMHHCVVHFVPHHKQLPSR